MARILKEKTEEEIERNLIFTSQVLTDLHSIWTPHVGQIPIGKALFIDEKKKIFIEAGRKFGKTDLVIYCFYRWALLNPNSFSYYIAPFRDQIRDLVWANGRLPYFLPENLMKKYGVTVNNSDFRVMFGNGSFIKCDGADNFEKSRGYSATGLSVMDEYKDAHPQFIQGFEPNLAITDAPIIFVGTPPDASESSYSRWCETADEVKNSPVGFYINRPSMTNPHISKEFFTRKEQELRDRGEYWRYEKEYLALRVRAAGNNIFPMLNPNTHIKSYKDMMDIIGIYPKQWDFYTSFDPGSAKCFAVLFVAINRYSKQIFVLDQIYATKLEECRVDNILPQSIKKMRDIMPHQDRWLCVYDYAATWFMNEAQSPEYIEEISLIPCTKDLKNKENKLSLIKDILLKPSFFFMSERCVNKDIGLFWEMEKYATDDKGKIPKENDHAIDALRYALNAANYHRVEDAEPLEEHEQYPERRGFRMSNDYSLNDEESMYGNLDNGLFDSGYSD